MSPISPPGATGAQEPQDATPGVPGMGPRGWAVFVLVFLCGTAVGGIAFRPGTEGAPGGSATPASPVAPVAVRAVTAGFQDLSKFLEAPGEVQSRTAVTISSRILSRILEIRVRARERVRRGDVLVVLDSGEDERQVQQATAALERARGALKLARAEFARTESLQRGGVESRQSLDRVRQDLSAAGAEEERLRQAVAEAQVRVGHARILSPMDGIVVDRLAEPGETATVGRPLLAIHDPLDLRFQAWLPESCFDRIQVGLEAFVQVSGVTERITAKVDELVPRMDPATHRFPVRLSLPGGLPIQPGTFGSLEVPCRPGRVLLIPSSAVKVRGQLEMVFVVAEEKARLTLIAAGRENRGHTQVLSGLSAGDVVVVDPPGELQDGMPVRIAGADTVAPPAPTVESGASHTARPSPAGRP